MRNVNQDSDEQLKLKIKRATEARKIVRKKMDELFSRGWVLKSGKYRLDQLLTEAKEELGRRKGVKCKALKRMKANWVGGCTHVSCLARELSYNRFRTERDLYRIHCYTCRWTKEQALSRMLILRIKNGKGMSR